MIKPSEVFMIRKYLEHQGDAKAVYLGTVELDVAIARHLRL